MRYLQKFKIAEIAREMTERGAVDHCFTAP